jgi:hypothetical protein
MWIPLALPRESRNFLCSSSRCSGLTIQHSYLSGSEIGGILVTTCQNLRNWIPGNSCLNITFWTLLMNFIKGNHKYIHNFTDKFWNACKLWAANAIIYILLCFKFHFRYLMLRAWNTRKFTWNWRVFSSSGYISTSAFFSVLISKHMTYCSNTKFKVTINLQSDFEGFHI